MSQTRPVTPIAIVGPCAAGKTTLAHGLQSRGLGARQIAQEHSYVQTMWQRLTQPDVLIYLDASYQACTLRKHLDWTEAEYAEQQRRLAHAREHCDIYIDSTDLSPEEVLEEVSAALGRPAGRTSR
jgi:deoxyadenosine/deoxycytidine kinase